MKANDVCERIAANADNPEAARRACLKNLRPTGRLGQEHPPGTSGRPSLPNYLLVSSIGGLYPIRAVDDEDARAQTQVIGTALANEAWFEARDMDLFEDYSEASYWEGPLFDSTLYHWWPETDEIALLGRPTVRGHTGHIRPTTRQR